MKDVSCIRQHSIPALAKAREKIMEPNSFKKCFLTIKTNKPNQIPAGQVLILQCHCLQDFLCASLNRSCSPVKAAIENRSMKLN